ncbi:hypothetical protein L6452_00158 [Arctium lappa]|uniref:Uncharacterized protein n=1 Tax=Arctium lappa TaxID=4217 RepID=A0ACB9FEJ6_ARCLA|nr:hypothetical protein L6452_00158 [Arctium lappa]
MVEIGYVVMAVSSKIFKDLEEIDYYYPKCKSESVEQPVVDNSEPKLRSTESSERSVLPDKAILIAAYNNTIRFFAHLLSKWISWKYLRSSLA